MTRRLALKISGIAVAAVAFAMPATAHAPDLEMLDRLERGTWTLSFRSGQPAQRICLRTGRELIQLQHRQPGCERFVVGDSANEVTVQYTCRGNGYGRTTIRRESNQLVQLRSQGIQGGQPFRIEGEGRRTGSC
ncbi:MAG: DUF3617 family protein [Alteraurantiacibacter sp.]